MVETARRQRTREIRKGTSKSITPVRADGPTPLSDDKIPMGFRRIDFAEEKTVIKEIAGTDVALREQKGAKLVMPPKEYGEWLGNQQIFLANRGRIAVLEKDQEKLKPKIVKPAEDRGIILGAVFGDNTTLISPAFERKVEDPDGFKKDFGAAFDEVADDVVILTVKLSSGQSPDLIMGLLQQAIEAAEVSERSTITREVIVRKGQWEKVAERIWDGTLRPSTVKAEPTWKVTPNIKLSGLAPESSETSE